MQKNQIFLAAPALAALLLCGCYESIDPPAQAESQPSQSSQPATTGPGTAGAPAAAGARRAAEGVTTDATRRSQEIADGDY